MGACMKILSWAKKRTAGDRKEEGKERERPIKRWKDRGEVLGKRVESESGESYGIWKTGNQ